MSLLKRLRESQPVDKVPRGWRTSPQWAAKWKVRPEYASRMLASGVAKGITQKRLYRVRTASGIVRAIWHYAEKGTR